MVQYIQAEAIYRKRLASQSGSQHVDDSGFQRVRVDIRDLYLHGMFTALSVPFQVPTIFVAKHLCGVAADLAFRGLEQQHKGPSLPPIKAVALATCCQHRCMYDDYVGHEFLQEWVSRTETD